MLVAFSQQCTHLSCAVVPQPEQNRLFCPCHEGAFDLQSGRPIAGPPNRPAHARDARCAGRRCLRLRHRIEDGVAMPVTRPFSRDQRATIVYGMLAFVLMLVILQLWLLTATMNAYLGGDETVIWPAAAASLLCLLLNVGSLAISHPDGTGAFVNLAAMHPAYFALVMATGIVSIAAHLTGLPRDRLRAVRAEHRVLRRSVGVDGRPRASPPRARASPTARSRPIGRFLHDGRRDMRARQPVRASRRDVARRRGAVVRRHRAVGADHVLACSRS